MLSKLKSLPDDIAKAMEMDGWTVHDLAEVKPRDITGYGISSQRALHVIVQARELSPTLPRETPRTIEDEQPPEMSARVKRIKEANE